jgi:hypothetical protein
MRRDVANTFPIRKKEHAEFGLTQARRVLQYGVEHWRQLAGGARNDAEYVGGGGLLLERFAQLVEQPRILDSDDRLGGEILDQLDLLAAEWSCLLPENHD